MPLGLEVTVYGFDSMENNVDTARYVIAHEIFLDDLDGYGITKLSNWLKSQDFGKPYICYDLVIYPEFMVKHIQIK